MRALDVSFDAKSISPEWAKARLDDGWKLLIVNLWTGRTVPDGAQRALQLWREAGGLTAAYIVVHDGVTAAMCVARAKAAAGDEWKRLAFVAVDVELEPITRETIETACALIEQDQLRPAIYTSRWFWQTRLNDSPDLANAGRPLWDADYSHPPSLDSPNYGGWTARVGCQYRGNKSIDGVTVDLNIFDDAWVCQSRLSPDQELANALDVVYGWSRQLAQAAYELSDVVNILARLYGDPRK